MRITEVSFAFASTNINKGTCGFCKIVIDDSIEIYRIVVERLSNGEYVVRYPSVIKDGVRRCIINFRTEDMRVKFEEVVLDEFFRITTQFNGHYKVTRQNKKEETLSQG